MQAFAVEAAAKAARRFREARDSMANGAQDEVETLISRAYGIAAEYRDKGESGEHRAHLSSDSVPYPLRAFGAKVGAVLAAQNLTCAMVNVHMVGATELTDRVMAELMRGGNEVRMGGVGEGGEGGGGGLS